MSFHNTLVGEIMISLQGLMEIYCPVMIHFHMQRFKVLWYASSKEEQDENVDIF